jgi:hypothetical protein
MHRLRLALASALMLAACGDHQHHHDHALVPGAVDAPAQAACQAFEGDTQPAPVPLGAEPAALNLESGLARFELTPATGRTISVTLAEHTSLALFTDRDDLTLQLATDDGTTYNLMPNTLNGACPDAALPDFRVHIHTAGPHTLRVPDDAEGTLGILLVAAEVGH